MPSGRGKRPTTCKQCGALASAGATISFRALCEPCAIANQREVALEMHSKSGPAFDAWRAKMVQVGEALRD